MNARAKLIEELRRDGTGHTGMGATRLVDDFQRQLANYLRTTGHTEAANAIDPEMMLIAEYVKLGRPE